MSASRSSPRVRGKEGRTGVVDADGVDELVEETGGAAPPLEDGDTLRTRVEGEELDEVRCARIVSIGQ